MATLGPSKIAQQFGYMDPDFLETLFPETMPYDVSKVVDDDLFLFLIIFPSF